MRYSALIIGLLAVVPHVGADDNFCYDSGAKFKSTYDALIEARDHCDYWDDQWFDARQEQQSCHTDRSGQQIILSIWRPTDSGAYMDRDICITAMEKTAYSCTRGGQNYYHGWGFRIDPGNGRC